MFLWMSRHEAVVASTVRSSGPVLLARWISFGRLSGSVAPPAAGVEVTLDLQNFQRVQVNQDGFQRTFLFRNAFSGCLRMNFRREGFYPENATGYEYTVNAGWESVYAPKLLRSVLTATATPDCARSGQSDLRITVRRHDAVVRTIHLDHFIQPVDQIQPMLRQQRQDRIKPLLHVPMRIEQALR